MLHALYDSLPKTDKSQLHNIAAQLAATLGVGKGRRDKAVGWLVGKKHCRYHTKRSDATRTIEAGIRSLESTRQKILFVLLVICAANRRSCYEEWLAIARDAPGVNYDLDALRDRILVVLGHEGWLASSKKYPVSAATAFACGLPALKAWPDRPHSR
jgi:hypothetical protein